MAICSMCMQSKEATALYVGEERVMVARSVCRGCRMSVEKVLNFITFRGFRVHLSMQARLWPDGMHEELGKMVPNEPGHDYDPPGKADGHGGEEKGSDPQTPAWWDGDPGDLSPKEIAEMAEMADSSPGGPKKRLRAS